MATASIHHTYQAPVTCGICETSEDVNWYCLDCKGNFCVTCKVNHGKTPIYRNHKMVPIFEGLKHQAAAEDCNVHLSSPYRMHCNDCHKLVCDDCITTHHKGHVLGKIDDALQKVQREINEYYKILETTYLPKCKSEEAEIRKQIADCKKVTVTLESNINDRRSALIKEVHRVCDDMIKKAKDEEKQNITDMEKASKKLQDTAHEIESMMTESKEALTKLASKQIEFNQEKYSLAHLTVPKTPKLQLLRFTPGRVNKGQIGQQIGTLQSRRQDLGSTTAPLIDVSITHRHKFENRIVAVDVVDAYHAWVTGYQDEKELRLVTIDSGKVMNRIKTKFDIDCFTLTTSREIITTDYFSKYIRIMTQTGKVNQSIKTNPNLPSGVCLTNNNEIVVCVNTPDRSNSKLVLYNRDGMELRTIKYTDKPVGYYDDQRVRQNNRGEYCVAHWGHNKVYVVDSTGALRYTYDGSGAGKMKEEFLPADICSDIYNHLFISDHNNHNIHMLDDGGQFVRFILTKQDGISQPSGLCIDKDGRLWVGQFDGGLCVVKYLK